MLELVEFLVKSLVDQPDRVTVEEVRRGDTVVYRVQPDPADVGKLIGRQGRVANAIRQVVQSAASAHQLRAVVDIGTSSRTGWERRGPRD
ncbi:MAG: KH domain-containing protein [Alicyclobacillus sp.]|nr:KH domain-containing protein [Alicyclobacillus sp.]